EAPGREITVIVELPRIGDPFVDKDQAGGILVEERTECVARTGRLFVIRPDALERLPGLFRSSAGVAELPSKFAPKRTYSCSVRLCDRVAGRDAVTYQHDAPRGRDRLCAGRGHHGVDARDLARRCP